MKSALDLGLACLSIQTRTVLSRTHHGIRGRDQAQRSLQRTACTARYDAVCRDECVGGEETALTEDGSAIDLGLCGSGNKVCCLPDEELPESLPPFCNQWLNAQSRRNQSWIQLVQDELPCPCTAQEAEQDNRFIDGIFENSALFSLYHPGAVKCYDGEVLLPDGEWYGQQCCYGKKPNDPCITTNSCTCSISEPCYLIVEGGGSGTLDKRFPEKDFAGHRHADLEPLELCSDQPNGFQQYTQYRPISNTNNCPSFQWIDLNENEDYVGRHECSFVQAGDRFYLFGGREQAQKLEIYDYTNNTWSTGASPPFEFNHFQAIEYEGLIWVIGSFITNKFPNEAVADEVFVYDPANDAWLKGPAIPEGRRRGGGGLQVNNGKFYLVGGNTRGHNGGFVPFLDEFDPRTGEWTELEDAPHERDHFHAVVIGTKLFAAGGRRTIKGNTFGDTVREVDVYDFTTKRWLASDDPNLPDNLPVPRAGAPTAAFDGKLLLAGGESGISEDAHRDVHALDPITGKWETLTPLNHPRHGTQAIVSGLGLYVAAGSPNRGGGDQKRMEVYNLDMPVGEASVAGILSAPSSVEILSGATATVTIQQVGGNQGVFVNSVAISGPMASEFVIKDAVASSFLVPNGKTHDVLIHYIGSDATEAKLEVEYSGISSPVTVTLLGTYPPEPSAQPSTFPSDFPSNVPSNSPTLPPTSSPTMRPTLAPTAATTANPTVSPTSSPTVSPTLAPVTNSPTAEPTGSPTESPTPAPTAPPTTNPTVSPTKSPTESPTVSPTSAPVTNAPTAAPTKRPTGSPTVSPTPAPVTNAPTASPTRKPTGFPTRSPTSAPITNDPTASLTTSPTSSPTVSPTPVPVTNPPTVSPTVVQTSSPTGSPSASPNLSPSRRPSHSPSSTPTDSPTASPTLNPLEPPSTSPTSSPVQQTEEPTGKTVISQASQALELLQTKSPTTEEPSLTPSVGPSVSPIGMPSFAPSSQPSSPPSLNPSDTPSASPTKCGQDAEWVDVGPAILFDESVQSLLDPIHSESISLIDWKWVVRESTLGSNLVAGVEVDFQAPFQLVLDTSNRSLSCDCMSDAAMILRSFPLRTKLELPLSGLCQEAPFATGPDFSDTCWDTTLSNALSSYISSEVGRRIRECMQEEVNAATIKNSMATAKAACTNNLLEPESLVAEILANVAKCGGVQVDEVSSSLEHECTAETAPKCSVDSTQCCAIDSVEAQVAIELRTSMETAIPKAADVVNDIANASGVSSSRFVILGSTMSSTTGDEPSRRLLEDVRDGMTLTVGILQSDVESDTLTVDIVHAITQMASGTILAGIPLQASPVELVKGDSGFNVDLAPSVASTTVAPAVLQTSTEEDRTVVHPDKPGHAATPKKPAHAAKPATPKKPAHAAMPHVKSDSSVPEKADTEASKGAKKGKSAKQSKSKKSGKKSKTKKSKRRIRR